MKKFTAFIVFSIFSLMVSFSQNTQKTVVFFGAVTSSSDISTINLTQDLFYTQFLNMNEYSVIDKRNTAWSNNFESDYLESNVLLFFTEIQETNIGWECTLTVIDMPTGKKHSKKNEYEGYYKILMDSKTSLAELLEQLYKSNSTVTQSSPQSQKNTLNISLESIAGTWTGENLITKIVILRSGRGFVIYKNGASMNIAVAIKNNTLTAIQTGPSNASYFPDLPREVALVVAKSADPIEWNLQLINNNTLEGSKTTLLPTTDNGISEAEKKSVPVIWHRQ